MGNSLGARKMAKVMKIDGETFKLKTPIRAGEVIKDYPDHVLIESEAVKHFGIRAKPLEPQQELKPRRLYFLIVLPKLSEKLMVPRRVRSGINMGAKERLESLMLSRRSSSDLSIIKPSSMVVDEKEQGGSDGGAVRIRVRVPKAQVEKLVEGRSAAEAAEKILELCVGRESDNRAESGVNGVNDNRDLMLPQQEQWKPRLCSIKESFKGHEKRVGFSTIEEKEFIY